ncbi:phospholipase D-like domain-containing protein [Micromonospora endolithica]|uniref:phospholipase D-like domain-containing protein n=1 Tax=Micromonospora endolithica TaxID=230091 RepID=UPI0011ADFE7D|nr:phosphatidylserine/phosphatidylglycerophosphate/cardiolipin synthase family protein [Micromonospora endolithica]TWJ24729.1 phosphatidylserine/phosphatidylglycerophosphate/cardiolipin synthase-like enzyme [Micromonospora endolithica]
MTRPIKVGEVDPSTGTFQKGQLSSVPIRAESCDDAGQQVVFSYRGSEPNIRDTVVELIDSAREKVFIASFRLGEDDLLRSLLDAVDRLRGRVYVITAWNDRSLARGLAELDLVSLEDTEADDSGSIEAQKKRFHRLTKAGIYVRGHVDCHAKFVVVDDRRALIGSANLETSALTGTVNRPVTGELGVLIHDQARILEASRFFARLWHESSEEARPGFAYALRQRKPVLPLPQLPAVQINATGSIIWTHSNRSLIAETIRHIISSAESKLDLATFSIAGIADEPYWVLDPLKSALDRGVRVRLLVRGRTFPAHMQELDNLASVGVEIYGDSLTHAKAVIADGRQGAIFSANLDMRLGLLGSVEAGVLLPVGSSAVTDAQRFLDHSIDHSDMTYTAAPG